MKRLFTLLILCVVLLSSFSLGATKQDVINAINAHYQVGDTNFRLPQKYINKGEAYLNSHELTSEQYSKILDCIYAAVAYAREIGHVRYKEYTKEQINKGLSYVLAACKAANVDMSAEMKNESSSSSSSSSSEGSHNVETTTSNKVDNAQKTVAVDDADGSKVDSANVEVGAEVAQETSGEVLISGEIQSGEAISTDIDIDALTEKIVYTEDDIDRVINRKLFFIYFVIFSILLVNILLIRLLFKKKWNKILKTILIVVLSIITLAILIASLISIYYIEELKIIYELYYLLY